VSGAVQTQRRVRVERNIYRRPSGVLEVGFKDGAGIQRWRTVDGGIMAARALRDALLARRGRGEVVARNARLRLGDAADEWMNGPVLDLRASTQAGYRNAVEQHLRPRFGSRKLDDVTADDLAAMVREMRSAGRSEATILVVLGVTGRIYKFAARRLGWHGNEPDEPDALLGAAEGVACQAQANLHGRPDRTDDRGRARAVPDNVHGRGADWRTHVRAVWPHLGRRHPRRPR